jgi:hypothetical protein
MSQQPKHANGHSAKSEMAQHAVPAPAAVAIPATRILPLLSRKIDILFSFWYVIYLFSVTFTDLHNFTASYLGVPVSALETMTLKYPPKFLTDLYFQWARTIDPLLYDNPLYWQVMEWVNILVLMPTSAYFIVAFLRGWNSARNAVLITASFTFYSLLICIGCTFFGPTPSPNPSIFLGLYVPYLLFPIFAIARVWHDAPFSRPLHGGVAATLTVAILATFTLYFTYTLKWFYMFRSDVFPSDLLPMLHDLVPRIP